jgi:hypothetical protein
MAVMHMAHDLSFSISAFTSISELLMTCGLYEAHSSGEFLVYELAE